MVVVVCKRVDGEEQKKVGRYKIKRQGNKSDT